MGTTPARGLPRLLTSSTRARRRRGLLNAHTGVFRQEAFGPVAAVVRARDEEHAVSATPQTERLVDAAFLAAMKPTAHLIKCARGAIVDQDALVDALRDGTIDRFAGRV